MNAYVQDIRHAARGLRRDALFTISTVTTLALGIGVLTGLFAIVNTVLLKPLAPHGDTVVRIWKLDTDQSVARYPISYPELRMWRDGARTLHSIAAISYADTASGAVLNGDEVVPVKIAPVSADFFPVVHGGAPLLGRWFTAADEGNAADPAVVVSEAFWRRVSGGDRSFAGRRLSFPGGTRAFTVVGVAPSELAYPHGTDLWVPIDGYFRQEPGPLGLDIHSRRLANFHFLGRVKTGVALDQVQAELDTVSRAVAPQFPDEFRVMPVVVEPLLTATLGTLQPLMLFLFGGAALLFLAAGGNVAALLLMRASTLARDVAVRVALGAGRQRIARQRLAESLLIAAIGALAGLAIARACLLLGASVAGAEVPRLADVAIDRSVLAFCSVAALIWVVTLGTLPLWRRPTHTDLTPHLSIRATRSRTTLRVMLVAQVAAAVLIAVAAGLLVRSFARLTALERGFDARQLAVLQWQLPDGQYPTPAAREAFVSRLIPALTSLPGVANATAVHLAPGTGQTGLSARMLFEGQQPGDGRHNPYGTWEPVVPSYFDTLGIPIVAGRALTEADDAKAMPVAVVSESVARRYWPGQNPIGKQLQFTPQFPWTTVVGVAADTRYRELTRDWLTVYFPVKQFFFFAPNALIVRTTGDAAAALPAIRRAVRTAEPGAAIHSADTMERLLANEIARPRTAVAVATAFSLLAIVVAAIGVYAVFAYDITQRRRELAVRAAVGASPRQIFGTTLRSGLVLGATGAAIGLIAASSVTRFLRAILFEIAPLDVASFAAAGLALLTIVGLASALPARRAARVDPAILLRSE